jgi:outer membrane protein assembly factor BamB
MKNLKNIWMICCLMTALSALGQSSLKWKVNVGKEVNWMKVTPMGVTIVSTKEALIGLDPNTGQTLWKHDFLGKMKPEDYQPIEDTPLVAIIDQGFMVANHVIMDVQTGRIIVNSKELDFGMLHGRFEMPALGATLFIGNSKKNDLSLALIDITSGQVKWKNDEIKITEQLSSAPIFIDNGIIFATRKALYRLDSQTGKIQWRIEQKSEAGMAEQAPKEQSALGKLGGGLGGLASMGKALKSTETGKFVASVGLYFAPKEGQFFYASNKIVSLVEARTGRFLWDDPVKLDGKVTQYIPLEAGVIIATGGKSPEIHMLDYQGNRKWGKNGPNLSGQVIDATLASKGLVIAMENSKGKNSISVLNYQTGEHVFGKRLKVDGQIEDLQLTPKGVFYRTTEEMNIQSFDTGKDLWDKSIKFKKGSLGCYKGKKNYVFGDGNIFEVNMDEGTVAPFIKGKVKMEEGEMPTSLRDGGDGFLLSAAQNVIKLGYDGSIMFDKYYRSPDRSLAGKLVFGTIGVIAAAAVIEQSAKAGMARSGYDVSGGTSIMSPRNQADYHEQQSRNWGKVASGAFAEAGKRFKASKSFKDSQVILTEDAEDGGKKGTGFVKINKKSGKQEGAVIIDDKRPEYEFDDVDNKIYYKSAKSEVACYKL